MIGQIRIIIVLIFSIFIRLSAVELSKNDVEMIMVELQSILRTTGLSSMQKKSIELKISNVKRILINNTKLPEFSRSFSEAEIDTIIQKIEQKHLFKEKIEYLRRLTYNSYFYMKQIHRIISLFHFPNDKKNVARLLIPKVIDPENVEVLYNIFWTQSDKEFINKMLPVFDGNLKF
ncbi:MAG: DUF4476 domain-containing protein [Candidatus Delongbacteria bacterium]|nr:DUF4476 domain-containing protein [Candidatus Delongbacteria bacterium]MBN2834068.1 DUF4476 domain-containing protein [Candidatus Delongbacteria bacterium]